MGPLFIVALYPIWSVYRLHQSGARGSDIARRLFSPTASWYNTDRGGGANKVADLDAADSNSSDVKVN